MSEPTLSRLVCGDRVLELDRPRVMGILNVTPDSFSDGGRYAAPEAALRRALDMVAEGADIIDVGGESTRPGADPVSVDEELERVIPVIERIRTELDTIISIDTSRAAVMRAAAAEGAGLVNDVRALRADGAMAAVCESGLPVCLMHMKGEPDDMQRAPSYDDVVAEVADFLVERREACLSAGIAAGDVLIDPGFGFGKTLTHNLTLLRDLERFVPIAPVLAGMSRKGMIGALIGDSAAERVHGSVCAAVLAVQRGASLVRVHDVGPTVRALAVLDGVEGAWGGVVGTR